MTLCGASADGPGGPGDRLLPWSKVRDITGLSRTTAWRRQKAGDFPLAIQISPGRVGWWESELAAWKASRAPRKASPLALSTRLPSPRPPPLHSGEAPAPPVKPAAPGSEPSSKPRTRRRRSGCEGQIAFEF